MNFSDYVKVAFEELQLKQELLIQKIGYEYLNYEPDDLAAKIRFYHKETEETHAEFGVALVGSTTYVSSDKKSIANILYLTNYNI